MNEGDSAGGQRGRNLALPAGTDRIISSISSAGQLPVLGPEVAASPMSRSPADERQHNFQQIQQQMQSTSPVSGHLGKPLIQQQQQQFTNNTVSLIPAGTVIGAGGALNFKQQQQFLVTSTNSASNVLLSSVSNTGNETNNSVVIGAQLASSGIIGSGNNNNATSASGLISANQVHQVGGINSGGGNTFVHQQAPSVLVPALASAGPVVGPIGSSVPVSPTARKRLKLEPIPVVFEVEHDISALKKLILEHKYMRLRSIKEKYSEHVAELFFLQSGGTMMEYPAWRKKPHTPAFLNFMRTYKLEPLSSNLEEAGEILKQQSSRSLSSSVASTNSSSLPQGAEIKIPGVGATPVAVSTQLPAAVAQLSQQGGTPIIPDPIGIGATPTIEKRKHVQTVSIASAAASSSLGILAYTSASASGSGLVPVESGGSASGSGNSGTSNAQHNGTSSNGTAGGNGQDQYTNKAKQEVYVMQRIQELQKEVLAA